MKNNTWYLIGIRHPENKSVHAFVESIEFRNHFWKEFKNTNTILTDNSMYAFRVKNKRLVDELKKCVQKAIPDLVAEVLEVDDSWFIL